MVWHDNEGEQSRLTIDNHDHEVRLGDVGMSEPDEALAGISSLPGRSASKQGAHEHTEIEAGDVNEIACECVTAQVF